MNCVDNLANFLQLKYTKKELIGQNELYNIAWYLVRTFELEDYVDNINIQSVHKRNFFANYNTVNKTINFNYYNYVNYEKSTREEYAKFYNNVQMISSLLHELKHAMQHRSMDNSNPNSLKDKMMSMLVQRTNITAKKLEEYNQTDNIKDIILKSYELKKLKSLYRKKYINLFVERQAECYAIDVCSIILGRMNTHDSLLIKESLRKSKCEILLSGYKRSLIGVKYPYEYNENYFRLLEVEYLSYRELIEISKDLSLEEKMIYGFPISNEEYNYMDDELHTSKFPIIPIVKRRVDTKNRKII